MWTSTPQMVWGQACGRTEWKRKRERERGREPKHKRNTRVSKGPHIQRCQGHREQLGFDLFMNSLQFLCLMDVHVLWFQGLKCMLVEHMLYILTWCGRFLCCYATGASDRHMLIHSRSGYSSKMWVLGWNLVSALPMTDAGKDKRTQLNIFPLKRLYMTKYVQTGNTPCKVTMYNL